MSSDITQTPSGRFLLRVDPKLHGALRAAAQESGLSLNEYCARKLATPGGNVAGPATAALGRAISIVEDALIGVVAFGSWARGELAEGSDVDLLMVVESRLAITRDLYRRWDAEPIRWASHDVEPHFVHLPDTEVRISGLWAEAAVDGIVLFEQGLLVSRTLVEIRGRIADGRLVRREALGQPYWVGAA